jgi:NTP pyrophosphatase (non-canonical NTP hydrolase)
MTPNEYQRAAARTLIAQPDATYTDQEVMIVWNAIGLAGEGGEFLEAVCGPVFGPLKVDRTKGGKELGDVLWYAAALCTKVGQDFHDVVAVAVSCSGQSMTPAGAGLSEWITFKNAIDLASRTSRVADLVKKAVFHRHGLNRDALMIEVIDVVIAVLRCCDALSLTLEDVMVSNIAKLKARYPEGYSAEASKGWQATR